MTLIKFAWTVVTGALGMILLIALMLSVLLIITPPVKAEGYEWVTGTANGESVNLIRNQITENWSWTTGTIGDDAVNLNENQITDEWSWTTGTIGDDTVNLNSLKIDWGNEADDDD